MAGLRDPVVGRDCGPLIQTAHFARSSAPERSPRARQDNSEQVTARLATTIEVEIIPRLMLAHQAVAGPRGSLETCGKTICVTSPM